MQGEIKIDQPGEPVSQKEDIVGEEIRVDHTLGQTARPMGCEKGEFGRDRPGETGRNRVGLRFGRGEQDGPGRDRERIGAAQAEIGTCSMQFGQGTAERKAMRRPGLLDPYAVEERHHRGRPTGQRPERDTVPVTNRPRAIQPARRQVVHQTR